MKFTVTVKTEDGTYIYSAIGSCSATIAMDVYDLFDVCAVTVMPS